MAVDSLRFGAPPCTLLVITWTTHGEVEMAHGRRFPVGYARKDSQTVGRMGYTALAASHENLFIHKARVYGSSPRRILRGFAQRRISGLAGPPTTSTGTHPRRLLVQVWTYSPIPLSLIMRPAALKGRLSRTIWHSLGHYLPLHPSPFSSDFCL